MGEDRPIATCDLSSACPLRCEHCYYYASPVPSQQLREETYLARLRSVRDRYRIRSVLWVGGEPLLRSRLLARALELFERNAVSTSAMVPIPTDLRAGLMVSIDGPPEMHDRLRGRHSFDRALKNLAPLRKGSFVLSTTLTLPTLGAIERLPEMVETTGALGVVVGFFVGPAGHPLRVDGAQRDAAIDRLLAVKRAHPGVLLNSQAALELFRPACAEAVWAGCMYRGRAAAFDVLLERREPCTFGSVASCDSCGCPMVVAQRARELGDRESQELLRALFVRAS